MDNSININHPHSSVVREINYYEIGGSSRNSLYSLIKKVIEKVLSFFHFTNSHNGANPPTLNSLSDRTSCYSAVESMVDMLPSRRDELKMRLSPMKRELVTLREDLKTFRDNLEETYRYDNPCEDKDTSTRLGTERFETYLLEDHPDDDDMGVYKTVNRANYLSNKIASLELDLEAYNARLENYTRRIEFINYEYGVL